MSQQANSIPVLDYAEADPKPTFYKCFLEPIGAGFQLMSWVLLVPAAFGAVVFNTHEISFGHLTRFFYNAFHVCGGLGVLCGILGIVLGKWYGSSLAILGHFVAV